GVDTVEDLFEALAAGGVTIASRLHGLMLSLVAHRPVIALSYERKVEALMRDPGNDAYCLDIRDFTSAGVRTAIGNLAADLPSVQAGSAAVVKKYADAISFQHTEIVRTASTTS